MTIDLTVPAPRSPVGLGGADLVAVVRAVARDRAAWQPRVRLPDGERWWTRLHGDDRIDVWLLTWLPGHATDLHDHGDSGAAFAVVSGALQEVRFTSSGSRLVLPRRTAQLTWVPPGTVHDVHAVEGAPAVSLHAYSPPLTHMTYYDRSPTGRLDAVRTVTRQEPEERTS
jgi:predicted metal-dependent enzyme (double-stranded beta helix superfamily)